MNVLDKQTRESEQRGGLALHPWSGGDLRVLRMLNESAGRPESDGAIFRRHGRYLDGWRDRSAYHYVADVDGVPVGTAGYGYGMRLGAVVYQIGWRMLPGVDALPAVDELLRQAARFPVPRFVIATVRPDDLVVAQVCRAAGFECLGEEDGAVTWRFDLGG